MVAYNGAGTRVAEQFADARQAIDYFTHKQIALPEVTRIEPGEPTALELEFRNIPRCDLKVYRIDLMKFSLLKRNLRGVFVADQIQGRATVIARAEGDRYAFFRGEVELGSPAPNAPAQQQAQSERAPESGQQMAGDEHDLLKNLRTSNGFFQEQQGRELQNIYKQNKKGVSADAAF